MKIIVSSLTYPLQNGVTVSINTAVDGFIERGHEIRIIAPDYGIKKFRPEHYSVKSSMVTKGIGVIIGKEERTFGMGARMEIKKFSQEFSPDAYWLHTLTWGPNAFENHMLASDKPKILFYHTLVEEYGRIYAGRIGAFTMRKRSKNVCNKMDAIMTPSKAMKEKLESYGVIKPINVIPTGIEPCPDSLTNKEIRKKFNIPEEFKILLYVGRVSKEKNLGLLLETMEKLKKDEFKAILLIVGPGDIEETKKEISQRKIDDRIILTGGMPKKETVRIYAGADAFVFSSTTETQGLVIGEAMISNTPVVALDSSIQKEVYPEGTAIIVRNPLEFPKKIKQLFEDENKTKEMIQTAKKFVDSNFSKELMINRQVQVFENLM